MLAWKIDFTKFYGGAQAVSLKASGCGAVASGNFSGIVYTNTEVVAAAWQIVAENSI